MDSLEKLLGIDPTDPATRVARQVVESDHQLIKDLTAARKQANLTRADVAELTGMDEATVARLESRTYDPHLSQLRLYAVAVGVFVQRTVSPPAPDYPRRG